MKVSPLFVIWQGENKEKARVLTDHSASGINDGIPRSEAKVRYDDMRSFGQTMREARLNNPGKKLLTFKSDIQGAFLNLSVQPIWQLRQVVKVDGKYYIVRRLTLGTRPSPRIFCAFSSLICWIGVRKLGLTGLHVYMDDFFGWDFAGNLVYFHGRMRPRRQVLLLILWDRIFCPYDDVKQDHGEHLKITGFWTDINRGTISLSPSTAGDIDTRITLFLNTPGRKPLLRAWLSLGGTLNWLFNVLPWGRPALTEVYRKIAGKSHMLSGVPINKEVRDDLTWLQSIIPTAIGVSFVDEGHWSDEAADMVMWTDASLKISLSFVYAGNGFVYAINAPPSGVVVDIFFLELIAILSAIHHAASLSHPPRRLLLFTDSLDSVQVFSSLHTTQSIHNGPLLAVAGIILRSGIDLRVSHIPGKENVRADLLSRSLLVDFERQFPSYRVRSFEPPRELLPTRWRESF